MKGYIVLPGVFILGCAGCDQAGNNPLPEYYQVIIY